VAVGRFLGFNWFPAFRKIACLHLQGISTFFDRLKLESEGTAISRKGRSHPHNNTNSLPRRLVLQLYRCDNLIACHTPVGSIVSVIKPQARKNILTTAILLFLSGERITDVTCTFMSMCVIQFPAFDGVPVAPDHSSSARHFVFTGRGNEEL
jgi:hypothetical protein